MSEPRVEYACTHIVKEAEQEHYEEGAVAGTRVCVMDKSCNITAPSLTELIEAIGKCYGLDIDDVFIPGDDDEDITWIGYNRLENNVGHEPSPSEDQAWRRGEETLYLADYLFHIEKRVVLAIHESDFDAAGITTH